MSLGLSYTVVSMFKILRADWAERHIPFRIKRSGFQAQYFSDKLSFFTSKMGVIMLILPNHFIGLAIKRALQSQGNLRSTYKTIQFFIERVVKGHRYLEL